MIKTIEKRERVYFILLLTEVSQYARVYESVGSLEKLQPKGISESKTYIFLSLN
jgi:hypothetical protein